MLTKSVWYLFVLHGLLCCRNGRYSWVVLWLLLSCSLPEERIEYYPNGNIKSRVLLRDGVKNGETVTFFSNGVVKSKQLFKNDTLNGLSTFFNDKGRIDSILNYENGIPNGEFLNFYSNGNVSESGQYKNGIHVGQYYRYYPYDSGKVLFDAYLLNVGGDIMQYYVKKFDTTGALLDDSRSININVLPKSRESPDTVAIEFELLDDWPYDSAIVVVGDFDDEFRPMSSPDTLVVKNRKAQYRTLRKASDFQSLKGLFIEYRRRVYSDSTVEDTTYGYFEEKLRIN